MTPREKFVKSSHRKEMEQISQSEAFNAACDYAMLEMQERLLPVTLPDSLGLDPFAKLSGAREIIAILKRIHEPVKEPNQRKEPTLNYQAGV